MYFAIVLCLVLSLSHWISLIRRMCQCSLMMMRLLMRTVRTTMLGRIYIYFRICTLISVYTGSHNNIQGTVLYQFISLERLYLLHDFPPRQHDWLPYLATNWLQLKLHISGLAPIMVLNLSINSLVLHEEREDAVTMYTLFLAFPLLHLWNSLNPVRYMYSLCHLFQKCSYH
jgi:hypothetical protein